uniref:Uncharacterized protein n=1 Tax=Macrostomum lignano TaxID=282301 RepID=A0A1I8JRH0_9PLAT
YRHFRPSIPDKYDSKDLRENNLLDFSNSYSQLLNIFNLQYFNWYCCYYRTRGREFECTRSIDRSNYPQKFCESSDRSGLARHFEKTSAIKWGQLGQPLLRCCWRCLLLHLSDRDAESMRLIEQTALETLAKSRHQSAAARHHKHPDAGGGRSRRAACRSRLPSRSLRGLEFFDLLVRPKRPVSIGNVTTAKADKTNRETREPGLSPFNSRRGRTIQCSPPTSHFAAAGHLRIVSSCARTRNADWSRLEGVQSRLHLQTAGLPAAATVHVAIRIDDGCRPADMSTAAVSNRGCHRSATRRFAACFANLLPSDGNAALPVRRQKMTSLRRARCMKAVQTRRRPASPDGQSDPRPVLLTNETSRTCSASSGLPTPQHQLDSS